MPSGTNDGARTAAVTTTDVDGAAVATIAGILRPLLADVTWIDETERRVWFLSEIVRAV